MSAAATRPAEPETDRGPRLVLFGVVAVLVGCGTIGLGALQALVPFLASRFPGLEAAPVDTRAALIGFVTYAALGVAFITVGVGSMRARRWSRPMMLILAWTWLLGGILGLALLVALADGFVELAAAGQELGPHVVLAVKLSLFTAGAIFGVALPALFVWVYKDEKLGQTLAARDPSPDWTDRCPLAVLALSVCLGAFAVLVVPMAMRPAVPMFGWIVGGWPGAVLMLSGAAACGLLARETYRLSMRGWWGTTVLTILAGVSTIMTFFRVEPVELYRELGYPEDQLDALAGFDRPFAIGLSFVMTVLGMGYMLAVLRSFRPGERSRGDGRAQSGRGGSTGA